MNISWIFFNRYLFSPRSSSLIKRISWLSFIGVFFGLFAFILILSVMQGLNKSLHKRILAVDPHLRILVEGVQDPTTHPVYTEISRHFDWRVQPFEEQEVILRSVDGLFRGAMARGITHEAFSAMLTEIQNLAAFSHSAGPLTVEAPEEDKIVLGVELARALGTFEGDGVLILPPESLLLPPGEVPRFYRSIVHQILATNLPDIDAGYLFYKKDSALSRLQSDKQKKIGFELWGKDPYQAEDLKKQLSSIAGVKIETWQERNSALFAALRMEKLVIGLFLGIAALITGFSVVSVMILLISQKRKEIGLLRSIGFAQVGVKNLFLRIGFLLAGGGIFCGVLLGTLVSYYIELHPLQILPDIYYDSEIPAQVNLSFISVTVLAALVVTFSSIILVLRGAFKEAPAKLLKGS